MSGRGPVVAVTVTGDSSDGQRAMKDMESSAQGLTGHLEGLANKIPGAGNLLKGLGLTGAQAGAAIGAGVIEAGKKVAEFVVGAVNDFQEGAQAVKHFGEVSGLASEDASKFIAVADDFEVSAEDLSTAIGKMNLNAENSPEKLKGLGIEIGHTKDGAYDAQRTFLNVVDAFNATDDASKKAAIGAAAFGKGWQSMAGLLAQGSSKISSAFQDVNANQIFSEADIKKSEDYRLALDDFHDTVTGLKRQLGEELVPAFTVAVEYAGQFARGVGDAAARVGDLVHVVEIAVSPITKLADWLGFTSDDTEQLGFVTTEYIGTAGKLHDTVNQAIEDANAQTESILQNAAATANAKYKADEITASLGDYSDEATKIGQKLKDDADAEKKVTDEMTKHLDIQHKIIDSGLDLEQAYINQHKALEDYNKTLADSKATDDEKLQSSIDYRRSVEATAKAEVERADQQALNNGVTLTAADNERIFKESIEKSMAQLDPNDPAMVWLQNYVNTLKDIPLQATTLIGVSISDPNARSIPGRINRYAEGGWVPGVGPQLAIVHGGEFVVSNAMQQRGATSSGGHQTIINNYPPGTDPRQVKQAQQRWNLRNTGVA